MPCEKMLTTIARLMEATLIHIGNEEYARDNLSYGLTTMRNKHLAVSGSTFHVEFPGKSGIKHSIDIQDRRLAALSNNV
jgi:DNA topoisomerase-1